MGGRELELEVLEGLLLGGLEAGDEVSVLLEGRGAEGGGFHEGGDEALLGRGRLLLLLLLLLLGGDG